LYVKQTHIFLPLNMLAALAGGQAPAHLDEAGMPDVITANRLTDGVVVFQTIDESWSEDFNRAAVLPDPETTASALARAKQDEANNIVVEPYAVAVEERNGHFAPKALREAIRATGPTIRRDLGKQALGQAPHSGPKVATETDHVSL
jgi:hypothetical protein